MDPFNFLIAIIGAGPIGLEMAIALKEKNISYMQFEKGQCAQMISNFPAQTVFFSSSERISIANFPIQTINQQKCTREEYLAYIRSLVLKYHLDINTYSTVISIKHFPDKPFPFMLNVLTASALRQYCFKYVIVATGGTSWPRLLSIPGEALPHVSTSMGDPHQYFQRKVLIVGGKNSAVETALRCFNGGAIVTLAIRNERLNSEEIKYWLYPEILGRIRRKEITCYTDCHVLQIDPGRVLLKSKHFSDGNRTIPADFVIKAIGFEADMSLFEQLNIKESEYPYYDPETMETEVLGLYILGTVVGGTQVRYKVFIENCHEHVDKIMRSLQKKENFSLNFQKNYKKEKEDGTLEE